MKADISRDSFSPEKDYSRVLMQQGRLQLDADWNEQVSIFWHFLRSFTRNLLGPYAGPASGCGFAILTRIDFDDEANSAAMRKEFGISVERQKELRKLLEDNSDFLIGPGTYYVDGIPCVNPDFIPQSKHSHMRAPLKPEPNSNPHLIYLDVWERLVTSVEDPAIREVALGGADTCARSKVFWQVRTWKIREDQEVDDWSGIIAKWQARHRGRLRARARHVSESGVSTIASNAQYRGTGNQLYRIEIHQGGRFGVEGEAPTFKWSRENGSITFPVVQATENSVTLASLGRDLRTGLKPGDWVEVLDDDLVAENKAEPLRQIADIHFDQNLVTFASGTSSKIGQKPEKHPLLRRWDHKLGDAPKGGAELRDGAVLLKEGESEKFWIALENGVQVQFAPSKTQSDYRTGDFWLIPARVVTGDVEWPAVNGDPQALPPHGVEHVYAPLALVSFNAQNQLGSDRDRDCRPKFKSVVSGF